MSPFHLGAVTSPENRRRSRRGAPWLGAGIWRLELWAASVSEWNKKEKEARVGWGRVKVKLRFWNKSLLLPSVHVPYSQRRTASRWPRCSPTSNLSLYWASQDAQRCLLPASSNIRISSYLVLINSQHIQPPNTHTPTKRHLQAFFSNGITQLVERHELPNSKPANPERKLKVKRNLRRAEMKKKDARNLLDAHPPTILHPCFLSSYKEAEVARDTPRHPPVQQIICSNPGQWEEFAGISWVKYSFPITGDTFSRQTMSCDVLFSLWCWTCGSHLVIIRTSLGLSYYAWGGLNRKMEKSLGPWWHCWESSLSLDWCRCSNYVR